MSRSLTAAVEAAIQEKEVHQALLFEGEFSSGFTRLWTGWGNLSYNGSTWIGAGTLMGVSDVTEVSEMVAPPVTAALDGIEPSFVSLILNEAVSNKVGRIYLALLDSSGAVIGDAYTLYVGRLSVPRMENGEQGGRITIQYDHVAADMMRPRRVLYTPESQKLVDDTDEAFDFVTALQEKEIQWGT